MSYLYVQVYTPKTIDKFISKLYLSNNKLISQFSPLNASSMKLSSRDDFCPCKWHHFLTLKHSFMQINYQIIYMYKCYGNAKIDTLEDKHSNLLTILFRFLRTIPQGVA